MMTVRTYDNSNSHQMNAIAIPVLSKTEAKHLAEVELQRCINLLEQISGEEWQQSTDCDAWTVKDMTAHLVGACAGYASWGEFRRQYINNPHMRKGEPQIDGINRRQVTERADKSSEELIEALREVGPKAINTRQGMPAILRAIRAPMPPLGVVSVRYLLDTIYPRDQWMHRADICRATGKSMHLTADHDARIVDLVAADISAKLKRQFKGTIELSLTGALELNYIFSTAEQPYTHIMIDILEFNRLASGRSTPEEAQHISQILGDTALAEWFYHNCQVGY